MTEEFRDPQGPAHPSHPKNEAWALRLLCAAAIPPCVHPPPNKFRVGECVLRRPNVPTSQRCQLPNAANAPSTTGLPASRPGRQKIGARVVREEQGGDHGDCFGLAALLSGPPTKWEWKCRNPPHLDTPIQLALPYSSVHSSHPLVLSSLGFQIGSGSGLIFSSSIPRTAQRRHWHGRTHAGRNIRSVRAGLGMRPWPELSCIPCRPLTTLPAVSCPRSQE